MRGLLDTSPQVQRERLAQPSLCYHTLVRSHEVGSLFSYRASSQPQPAVLLTLVLHLRPSPITIFALFQRVDQAVPELAVPAAAAWLLRRTAQLPAWAPLLFRLVAMEENSAAKVGPPALGVLSESGRGSSVHGRSLPLAAGTLLVRHSVGPAREPLL